MLKIRQTATIYFAFQGIAVILWWILLFLYPQARNWFQMGDSEMILMSFWLPDLLFLGIGSLAASFLIIQQSKFLKFFVESKSFESDPKTGSNYNQKLMLNKPLKHSLNLFILI